MPGRGAVRPGKEALRMKAFHTLSSSLLLAVGLSAGCRAVDATPSAGAHYTDAYTLVGETDFFRGYPAVNADGTVNVVVEIPAGTNQKWEVDESDGVMRWEFKNGAPRVVKYLGYPGNYGMIPRTLMAADEGGDGDPLDVIVIGAPAQRGDVLHCRVIGVLAMLDGGERDDKLLAVCEGNALSEVRSLEQLDAQFAGARSIVETWFTNYKGPGKMEPGGWSGPERAADVLASAAAAYAK